MARTICILLLFSLSAFAQQQRCWYPGGNEATDHSPCPNVNANGQTSCCHTAGGWPHVDPCMSNGYCFSMDIGVLYRGSCTDRSWDDPVCPQDCREVSNTTDARLAPCSNGNLCCTTVDDVYLRDCCNSGNTSQFSWPDANFVGPLNGSELMSVTDAAPSISGLSSAKATVTATAESDGVSTGAIVGVGVALGVLFLIAAATAIWLFLALKKERSKKSGDTKYASMPYTDKHNEFVPVAQQNAFAPQQQGFSPPPSFSQQGGLPRQDMAPVYETKVSHTAPAQHPQYIPELSEQRERAEAPGS